MTRLEWSRAQFFDEGVDRGVVYPLAGYAVWAGLSEVTEVTSGGDTTSVYFDGTKTIDMVGSEDFQLDILAYTYPPEVETAEVSGDFVNLTYRTGSVDKRTIHLVYNAVLTDNGKTRKTTTNAPAVEAFGWSAYCTPTKVTGAKPTSHLYVDTDAANPKSVESLENILYGTPSTPPRFPSTDEVLEIFAGFATLMVIDHGDGTWTAIGPDDAIQMVNSTTFEITWPSAIYIDDDSYTIESL